MNAEIISVGTELILGNVLNSHAYFLSQQLASIGIHVYYHTTVGDNAARLQQVISTGLARSDLIILTGGLGPTEDDLTKETVCNILGISCLSDDIHQKKLKNFFSEMHSIGLHREMKQAQVPEGAMVLPNDYGTALGYIIQNRDQILILLPGPPRELQPMFLQSVQPYLKQYAVETIVSRMIEVFSLSESEIEQHLTDLMQGNNPTVALYAKTGYVQIRITAKARTRQQTYYHLEPMIKKISLRLGNCIYAMDGKTLDQTVVEQLAKKQKTIAVAESCTGGMIAQKITSVPGASHIFHMGIITYSDDIKCEKLGVLRKTIQQFGAVSEQTAIEMAKGLSEESGADYNLAITGIAGPAGGSQEKPVGTVYIALEYCQKVWCEKYCLASHCSDREYIRELATLHALNMVRLTLSCTENYQAYFI